METLGSFLVGAIVSFIGYVFGVHDGKHKERMKLLYFLRRVQVSEMTPNTRLHVLYVVEDMIRQLQKEWK